jgi:hypothetical protein
MTISDEISIIANKLANEGKTPTVALVKAKMRSKAPLPQIIQTLKNWQHDANFTSLTNEQAAQPLNEQTITINKKELSALIQQELAPLKQEIAQLKLKLEQLSANQ